MRLTIEEMRRHVADDLYDTVTNDRRMRSVLVDQTVDRMSDDEIREAYEDAGLGESIDNQEVNQGD